MSASKLHECTPVDLGYFDTAPIRVVVSQAIAATPAEVFACLEDGAAWPRWVSAIRSVDWTSPLPFGLGTTRTVYMKGGLVVEERFFVWEPGQRMAFHFVRANAPVSSFAEDYRIEATEDGKARLQWRMALTPAGVGRITAPLASWAMTQGCRFFARRLARLVEREYVGPGRA